MLKEYDVVKAKKDLSELILKGCKGAILMVLEEPNLAYEVEFVNAEGDTIDVITAYSNDIELQKQL